MTTVCQVQASCHLDFIYSLTQSKENTNKEKENTVPWLPHLHSAKDGYGKSALVVGEAKAQHVAGKGVHEVDVGGDAHCVGPGKQVEVGLPQ